MTLDFRDAPAGFLVGRQGLFTPQELDRIVAIGEALAPMKAQIAGREDDTDYLRVTRVAWIARTPDAAWLYDKIEQAVLALNDQFYKYELYGLVESFQYTVYESAAGGHYDWHCDTGKTIEPRKISLTLQLSDPADYEGGELLLEAGEGQFKALKGRGTLVAFPSYIMHRVTPVTSGIRKSLVVWVAGPAFR